MSLEKIANNEALTREDIVSAASEYVELEKQAAEAEEIGRQAAHEDFAKQAAEAEDTEKVANAIETLKRHGVN